MPCWFYEKRELMNSPSIRAGMEESAERALRAEGASFIMRAGSKLGLASETCATGIVYFHRFYMHLTFQTYPRYVSMRLVGPPQPQPQPHGWRVHPLLRRPLTATIYSFLYCKLLSTTNSTRSSLFNTISQQLIITISYFTLSTIIYHYLPLSTTIYHYLPLSSTIYHYLPLSTTIYHYLPLFITFFTLYIL